MEAGDNLDQRKSALRDSAGLIQEEMRVVGSDSTKRATEDKSLANESLSFITNELIQKNQMQDETLAVESEGPVNSDNTRNEAQNELSSSENILIQEDAGHIPSEPSRTDEFVLRESEMNTTKQNELGPPLTHMGNQTQNETVNKPVTEQTISSYNNKIDTHLSEGSGVEDRALNCSGESKNSADVLKEAAQNRDLVEQKDFDGLHESLDTCNGVTGSKVSDISSGTEEIHNNSDKKIRDFIHHESGALNNEAQSEDSSARSNQGAGYQEGVDDGEHTKLDQEDEWLDILGSGQLKKKVIKKAENSFRPQNSFICTVNVEGCLPDGTVVEKLENLKLQVGDVEVVQGIDLALPLMDVGEVALLDIGPRFAYGSLGRQPDIPPDTKLMYTVELLSAENEPDLESMSIAERKTIGNSKRERGNWWFSRQEYSFAIQSYRRAIEYLDDVEGGFTADKEEASEGTEKQLQDLLEDRLKVFNNLAAAQMKIKAYDTALTSVENVLRCQPQNVKALFRKGKILAAKGETESAVSVLRIACQLEPESRVIKQELQRLVETLKETTKQEKNLYKKMLGHQNVTEKKTKSSKMHYISKWGLVCSSIAVVLLGAVAYRYKFL